MYYDLQVICAIPLISCCPPFTRHDIHTILFHRANNEQSSSQFDKVKDNHNIREIEKDG